MLNTIVPSSFNPPNKKDIAVPIRTTYSTLLKKAHLSIYNTDNEADWLNKAFLADRNIKNNLFPLP